MLLLLMMLLLLGGAAAMGAMRDRATSTRGAAAAARISRRRIVGARICSCESTRLSVGGREGRGELLLLLLLECMHLASRACSATRRGNLR